MGDTADRLQTSRDTSLATQRIQEDIVRKLDQLIKAAEQNQQQSRSQRSQRQQQKQQQQQPQQQQGQQRNPDGKEAAPDTAEPPSRQGEQLNPGAAVRRRVGQSAQSPPRRLAPGQRRQVQFVVPAVDRVVLQAAGGGCQQVKPALTLCVLFAASGAMAQVDSPPAAPAKQPAAAASAQNNAAAGEITPELDAAITKGIKYLASQQTADGSFGDGRYGKNVAVSALAGIALMADGNLPGRGEHGDNVAKCVEYILANCTESGLIASDAANGPMYGHGFATLFLGEVYGMTAGGGDTATAKRVHEAR